MTKIVGLARCLRAGCSFTAAANSEVGDGSILEQPRSSAVQKR